MQKRQAEKSLWPGFWSNSCCSHPRWGEDLAQAAKRRVSEELGFVPELTQLFSFEYRAEFNATGTEHELCTVFAGRVIEDSLAPNDEEIEALERGRPEDVDLNVKDASQYTPWFQLAWKRIRRDHWTSITELAAPESNG